MLRVYSCIISNEDELAYAQLFFLLPQQMQEEVKRIKATDERLLKLGARLLMMRMLNDLGYAKDVCLSYKLSERGKPAFKITESFSIAHSGKRIVLICANDPIGIDLEKKEEINWRELKSYFHPKEQAWIDGEEKFFTTWARKESLFKLTGEGISEKLNTINCIERNVKYYYRDYSFYEVALDPNYQCSICTLKPIEKTNLEIVQIVGLQNIIYK